MSQRPYDIVIGLEVHVQLKTKTKLFCRCTTQFGLPPNSSTCPVCIGLPGALPVMNREAFALAMKTAIAINCNIPAFTKWDRKQYYYPDLPKGYQISQYDLPMSEHGWLEISDPKGEFEPKRVGITRAHLEEDAGKSLHDEVAGKADSRIDLNRTGTPLLEIVSEPDMRSPREAKAYLNELKLILEYLDVSDCNMQEGSLRVDANVNLHIHNEAGKIATPIVEIKNMNSFRAVERAIAYEAERQYDVFQQTGQKIGDVPKQTRGWDDQQNITRGQRHKEESSDYRYFPDPDLCPVLVKPEEIAAVRANLDELPSQIRARLEKTYGITPYDSDVIVSQGPPTVAYFQTLADSTGDGKRASNWVQQEVLRVLNEQGGAIQNFAVPALALAELLKAMQAGDIDISRAKEVFNDMAATGKSAAVIMQERGIAKVDSSAIRALCAELLAANPRVVADVKAGKEQAVGAMVGQAKKQNPNVNAAEVRTICLELIQQM
ncbi:MAG TPA: Asp-tRNA(Asn)/Glu-tRNA(Gln) amidotransferase subunit GatB [Pirellulaceae bacterium]|nr:Asp-tRNA(Asn)/Glu-tRNA(Gln) amidotransferase subunit GatB [Pirellulaceae bacterium]